MEELVIARLMANQAADNNFMPSKILEQIVDISPDTKVIRIHPPLVYTVITGENVVHCTEQAIVSMHLKI